jgi:hypothetical protein
MAVTSCYLNFGRDYTASSELRREHTENYIIQCDSEGHSPYQVSKLARRVGPDMLPALFDPHPHDRDARVTTVQVTQVDSSAKLFTAVVKFDTTQKQTEGPTYTQNPTNRPVKYQLELMQFERVTDKDLEGRPLLNSCGMPFDPPLMQDDSRQVLVGIRNIRTLGEVVQMQQFYKDAVNINSFYGAKPRQAKVVSITAGEKQKEAQWEFYEVAIRVAFKGENETWTREVLNQGMARFSTAYDPSSLTTKGLDGEFINTPILLRLDGTAIPQDAISDGSEEPVFIPFKTYPERDFRGLGI